MRAPPPVPEGPHGPRRFAALLEEGGAESAGVGPFRRHLQILLNRALYLFAAAPALNILFHFFLLHIKARCMLRSKPSIQTPQDLGSRIAPVSIGAPPSFIPRELLS